MEVARILENKEKNKIYGLMGNIDITTNNNNYAIITDYKFSSTASDYLSNKKSEASLKMVGLDESYLEKTVPELSEVELKKINLAHALIANKEYIVLDYFEKGMNHKEKENFKRFFKKLSRDYNKTIIIFTNDITFIWEVAEELFIVDNTGVINNILKKNYFDNISDLDKPNITKFIDLIREKNIDIENYKNVLDLLKAIYRLKGE